MHRKALVFQKHYLQCQLDAFYQTQQAALVMMADMGAPVDFTPKVPYSRYPRPYARFRAIGCVVIATLRIQFLRRRKLHHLRSKISRISTSPKLTSASPIADITQSHTSPQPPGINPSRGIQSVLSSAPQRSPVAHPSPYPSASTSLLGGVPPSLSGSHTAAPPPTRKTGNFTHASKSSPSPSQKFPNSKHPAGSGKKTHRSSPRGKEGPLAHSAHGASVTSSREDPQLSAYVRGLERLQARLSKTKHS